MVSNVYEGGLKTWECSLDLIDALDGIGVGETIKGKSILEVCFSSLSLRLEELIADDSRDNQLGCGTALPSCFLFYTLLKQILSISTEPSSLDDSPSPPTTTFHLQDYNRQGIVFPLSSSILNLKLKLPYYPPIVLSLITLPNLLLAYAHVLASEHGVLPPGEVDLSPEFLSSFTRMLEEKKIILEFSEGSWDGMNVEEKKFGLVISSETIYSLDSLGSLLGVLKRSCWSSSSLPTEKEGEKTTTCLIAAKRIYFGVGGGELEFRKRVTAEEVGGKVETVWGEGKGDGKSSGVGRIVMSVLWP